MAEQSVERPPPTWSRRHEARTTTSTFAELGAGHPEPTVRRKCGARPLDAPIKLNLPPNLGSPRKAERIHHPTVLQPIPTPAGLTPVRRHVTAGSGQAWVDFGCDTPTTPTTPGHKHSKSMGEVLKQASTFEKGCHRRVFSADSTNNAGNAGGIESVFDEFSKLAVERSSEMLKGSEAVQEKLYTEKTLVDLDAPNEVQQAKQQADEPDLIWIEEREWLKGTLPDPKMEPVKMEAAPAVSQPRNLRRVTSVPAGQYFQTPRGLIFVENTTLAAYGFPVTQAGANHNMNGTMGTGMGPQGSGSSAPGAPVNQMGYSAGAHGHFGYGVESVFQSSAGIW